jgi:flagellin-like hook-associated protein FlgL
MMPYAKAWSVYPRVNESTVQQMMPADYPVAYKLSSKMNRTSAIIQNSQNALSYLQMQDSSLSAAGKIVDRMAELRTMAQDITKNTGDIENYSKEFMELQGQLNQIQKEKFNGISLFSTGTGTSSGILNRSDDGGTYIDGDGNSLNYDTFSRTLQTHDSGRLPMVVFPSM